MNIKLILKNVIKVIIGIILLIYLINLMMPMKFKREGMVNVEELLLKLFGEYPSYFYKENSRKETTQFNYATIKKKEMDDLVLQKKIKYLKEHGWRQVYLQYEDQIAFCHGKQNRIIITYPTKLNYEDGMKLTEDDLKKWIINYNYDYDGVRGCGK